MVSYSPRAAKAQAKLKQFYNDVDIFVEDTANHNMWLLIARRLLPAGTKLDSVNMLGGRSAVTKACELDQRSTGRRKLYIIDGDLDFLLDAKRPRLKYFLRLHAHNVENLLLTEAAIVAVALEQQPLKTEQTLRSEIDFDSVLQQVEGALRALFIVYAVVNQLSPSLKTSGYSVHKMLDTSGPVPILDICKLRRRAFSLYLTVARDRGTVLLRHTRDDVSRRSAKLPLAKAVSGKGYILPLFYLRFRGVCGYPVGDESFKVALSRTFSPSVEPYFARRMRNLSV